MLKVICFYILVVLAIILLILFGAKSNGILIALIAVVGLGGGMVFEYRKRQGASQGRYSLTAIAFVILMLALGLLVGWLLPTFELKFLPFGLPYSLLIFFIFGVPELILLRRVSSKLTEGYYLNDGVFPYFALGVAVHIVLRTY